MYFGIQPSSSCRIFGFFLTCRQRMFVQLKSSCCCISIVSFNYECRLHLSMFLFTVKIERYYISSFNSQRIWEESENRYESYSIEWVMDLPGNTSALPTLRNVSSINQLFIVRFGELDLNQSPEAKRWIIDSEVRSLTIKTIVDCFEDCVNVCTSGIFLNSCCFYTVVSYGTL